MRLFILLFLLPLTVHCQDTLYNDQHEPIYIKYNEETPIPPDTRTTIDNVDTKIVYAGSWYSGSTTAPGFYPDGQPTMAYSSMAGNTATFNFTGTSIEVFCEKKVGHGSGIFQVDNQTPITIPLGEAGPVGSTSVFKVENIAAGNHVFKLTISGNGYVVLDYLKINGIAVTPTPPSGTLLLPGVSMKTVVEAASSGTMFQLGNGTYPETIVNVPIGVSILPPSSGVAVINYSGSAVAQGSQGIIQLKSGSSTNGNQTISGFTLKGNNLANGGIIIENRTGVIISDVKIENMTFFGGWVVSSTVDWGNSTFTNTSWASTGWCSGELNLFNPKGRVHHNTFTNTLNTKGYGIKSMWGNNTWDALVIEENTFNLVPSSVWKNGSGPNIDIEFHDTWVGSGNVIIQNNKLKNMISATGNKTTGNTGRWIIRNNEFTLQAGSTCHVEVACNNIDIKNNIMRGASIITANFVANAKYNDCVVDGNDFVSNNANPGWGGTFLIGPTGVTNFVYKNNKITKGSYTLIKYMGVTGGTSDGGGNTYP